MTNHSVWGGGTPPAVPGVFTDGSPSIRVGGGFYRANSSGTVLANARIVGGSVYTPSGSPTTITIGLWLYPHAGTYDHNYTLDDSNVVTSKTVTVVQGGWTTVIFDTPTAMPADGYGSVIGYWFPTATTTYLYSHFLRPNQNPGGTYVNWTPATDGSPLYWSEDAAQYDPAGTFYDSYYQIGGPGNTTASTYQGGSESVWYGIDIVVDEGASGTLSGTATGTVTAAGSATGSATHAGTVNGGVSAAGSVTGQAGLVNMQGGATGTVAIAGTASGGSTHLGSTVTTITVTALAQGPVTVTRNITIVLLTEPVTAYDGYAPSGTWAGGAPDNNYSGELIGNSWAATDPAL